MIILIFSLLYSVQLILQHCNCLNLIDLPLHGGEVYNPIWKIQSRRMYEPFPKNKGMKSYFRRHWLGNDKPNYEFLKASRRQYEDERDANLKSKIATLVQQALHDINEKMKEVDGIKRKFREKSPYRAGFVLSMVKKSKDVLNELFNVAIRHRDEWQALEQLKIFELIVHTNIDTNNLLKQLIDIQSGRDVVSSNDNDISNDTDVPNVQAETETNINTET